MRNIIKQREGPITLAKWRGKPAPVKGAILKRCTKCKKEKPPDDFPKETRSADGKAAACKVCTKEYHVKHAALKKAERELYRIF